MTSLSNLVDTATRMAREKEDIMVRPSGMSFAQGELVVDQGSYPVNEHALGQLANYLKVPVKYLKRCPPHLQDDNVNYWLSIQEDNLRRVRLYQNTTRAFLSRRYTPIDNLAILQIAEEMLAGVQFRVKRSLLSVDQLHLRLTVIDGVGPDGNYGFGAFIRNSETGTASLMVSPFLQRNSCENSTIFTEEALKLRHVHHSLAFVRGAIKEYLGKAFMLAETMIEHVIRAEEETIPDLGLVVADLVTKLKMTNDEQNLFRLGTENSATRMGVVNGLTFAARGLADQERAVTLEAAAGGILCAQDDLFGQAAARAEKVLAEKEAEA